MCESQPLIQITAVIDDERKICSEPSLEQIKDGFDRISKRIIGLCEHMQKIPCDVLRTKPANKYVEFP